jgi:hypothetical protein
VAPFLYVPDKAKISPLETSDIELNCAILYGDESSLNNITWRWSFNNGQGPKVLEPSSRVSITNTNPPITPNTNSRLSIKEIMLTEKGFYECMVMNDYGQTSNTINVNVKSKIAQLICFQYLINSLTQIYFRCIVALVAVHWRFHRDHTLCNHIESVRQREKESQIELR